MSKKEKEQEQENISEEIILREPEKKEESGYISVYCGPDFPKFGLKRFRIYRGGLPLNVTEAAIVLPEVMRLIVPYGELENMRRKCDTKGTPEYEYCERVRSEAARRM